MTTPAPPPEKPAPAPVPVALPEKAAAADTVTVRASPPPIPTGFPEPAAAAGPATTTDTGELLFPQPMPPARAGYVNLATVPPMGSLTVPPLQDGGEAVVIDVYGVEVDEATADRAHAAARAAGLTLREL